MYVGQLKSSGPQSSRARDANARDGGPRLPKNRGGGKAEVVQRDIKCILNRRREEGEDLDRRVFAY